MLASSTSCWPLCIQSYILVWERWTGFSFGVFEAPLSTSCTENLHSTCRKNGCSLLVSCLLSLLMFRCLKIQLCPGPTKEAKTLHRKSCMFTYSTSSNASWHILKRSPVFWNVITEQVTWYFTSLIVLLSLEDLSLNIGMCIHQLALGIQLSCFELFSGSKVSLSLQWWHQKFRLPKKVLWTASF